jgi:hypothetical protein
VNQVAAITSQGQCMTFNLAELSSAVKAHAPCLVASR